MPQLSKYTYVCDHCQRLYHTDNSWIICDRNLNVTAYLCSEKCRKEKVKTVKPLRAHDKQRP